MSEWFIHDPGAGRVGPLDVADVRERFRSRRIGPDTLVWRDGMREWQPLSHMIEELGLLGIRQDTSLPPPVPPSSPIAANTRFADAPGGSTAASSTTARAAGASARGAGQGAGRGERPKSNGCLIAAIILGVAGLVLLLVVAAIAIPAYREYRDKVRAAQAAMGPTFDRERMAATEALSRELVIRSMREFYIANGNACPEELEFEKIQIRHRSLSGDENGWFTITPDTPGDRHCAYRVSFLGLGPEVKDKTVRYDVRLDGGTVDVACRNVDLPAGFAPPDCP